jgi:hypothetical protein
MSLMSGHVSSDRLGDAARHGGVEFLRDAERRHVQGCDRCQRLYGGYRLTDRLLAAPWSDVKLPPAAARPSRRGVLAGFVRGLDARSMAPALAAIGIVALIGAAVALPQLIPAPPLASGQTPIPSGTASSSPSAPASPTIAPSGSGQPSQSPGAQQSSPDGPGPSSPAQPTPATTGGGTARAMTLPITRIGGSPIAWSPDGAHLLVWGSGSAHQLQIRDAAGHLNGTAEAEAAAWVSSSTIAIATHSSGASPSASPTGLGHHSGSSPGRSGGSEGETVGIIDLSGHSIATLPGGYVAGGGVVNGMIVGSGSGEFTIASQSGSGSPTWSFVLWNGSVSAVEDGLPIAFSQDSRSLAVLHPRSVSGGAVTGWLEILAVPSLKTVASFTHLSLRVGTGSLGSDYGFDAAFSPDGGRLLASGTLVNLANGSTLATGKGGWLPDGTLVTSSNAGLLRWQGTHSSVDSRFPGMGTVETAHHGELIYFYGDGRPSLLLDTDGSLGAISLSGVRSLGSLLISPNGRAIAFGGRATDGSSIAAVATLP